MKNPNSGRTLKSFKKREPKVSVYKNEWVKEVSNRTGYPENALRVIFREMIEVWKDIMLDKKVVAIVGLGRLYAALKPGKNMVDIVGDGVYYKPDFYVPKLAFSVTTRKKIGKIEVLPEEVEDMYVD